MARDNRFFFVFKNFYQGFSPMAHLNSLTEMGNEGHASAMKNVDVLSDVLTQGPALVNLGGTAAVTELINFIMDQAVSASVTYGIGPTKLFKITPTAVTIGGTPVWPQTITNCADGQSLVKMGLNLYGFYNKSSGGDILKMLISSGVIDPNWGSDSGADGPTGYAALQKGLHPSAVKEDIIVFGNVRYVGTYIEGSDTLAPTKLDFGLGNEVADVAFHANQWLIAVNSGITGTNRNTGKIYLWSAGALSSLLDDEASIGPQKIGFVYPINGIIYVAYQDLSSDGGYMIGYLSGRRLKPLAYFTGSLPTFAQKTLFKNTILFVAGAMIYSCGAVIDELPVQLSQLADGGHAIVGALAAPFGVPMVASTDGSTSHRLAKFSGFEVDCQYRTVIVPLVKGRLVGYIKEVIVLTQTLGADARCDLQLEYDQANSDSGTVKQITGTGKRRHVFKIGKGGIEDMRVFLDWTEGHAVRACPIREVQIEGHYVQK